MLAIDNFVRISHPQDATRRAFQSIVKGRKSWKTLRGNQEAVWPPELEVALLEGLVNYQPNDSRETRLLGRFPLRNKFISDHILRVTGKRRTAKQVGSRIQQLRDGCGGKQLLHLLSYNKRHNHATTRSLYTTRPLSFRDPPSSSVSDGSTSPPMSPTIKPLDFSSGENSTESTPRPAPTLVYIDLIPDTTTWSGIANNDDSISAIDFLPGGGSLSTFRPSPQPRSIWDIDPTVTFVYHSIISASAFFAVFLDGHLVHTEITSLTQLDTPLPSGGLLYTTPLIPGYWETICQSIDPARYSVVQDVFLDFNLPNATPLETDISQEDMLFSAMYKFCYPTSKPPLQPSDSSSMSCLAPMTSTLAPSDARQAPQYFTQGHADVTKGSDCPIDGQDEYCYSIVDDAEAECNMARKYMAGHNAGDDEQIFPTDITQEQDQKSTDDAIASPLSTSFLQVMDMLNYIMQ